MQGLGCIIPKDASSEAEYKRDEGNLPTQKKHVSTVRRTPPHHIHSHPFQHEPLRPPLKQFSLNKTVHCSPRRAQIAKRFAKNKTQVVPASRVGRVRDDTRHQHLRLHRRVCSNAIARASQRQLTTPGAGELSLEWCMGVCCTCTCTCTYTPPNHPDNDQLSTRRRMRVNPIESQHKRRPKRKPARSAAERRPLWWSWWLSPMPTPLPQQNTHNAGQTHDIVSRKANAEGRRQTCIQVLVAAAPGTATDVVVVVI
jgi:hypothetical protein